MTQVKMQKDNQLKTIPVSELTDYLIDGWTMLPNDDSQQAQEAPVKNNQTSEITKQDVINALQNVDVLNAAITYLGDHQTSDELASFTTSHHNNIGFSAAYAKTGVRLWQWITGKDTKTFEQRWPEKCISHKRASGCFHNLIVNHEGINDAVGLAQKVASFHWRQITHICDPSFVGKSLPKVDEKPQPTEKSKAKWFDITGAEVLQVKGGGTQILWDSKRIWLPTSQMKHVNGKLSIPEWLSQKNDM